MLLRKEDNITLSTTLVFSVYANLIAICVIINMEVEIEMLDKYK